MKRLLSLTLAMIMAVTSLTVATSVFADDTKTATITLTASAGGSYVLEPYQREVSADLSDKYADKIGYNDDASIKEPTLLDAAIALHIDTFGENFTDDDSFTLSDQGWINNFMNLGNAVGYWKNNVMAGGISETVANGDFVYFGAYQDTSYWGDLYIFADSLNKTGYIGEDVTVNFTAAPWGGNTPAANKTVYVNGTEYGKTDDNGNITVSIKDFSEIKVELRGEGEDYIFPAYCKIKGSSKLFEYIKSEIDAGVKYTLDKKSFTLGDAIALFDYISTDYDMSEYIPAFEESVNTNLSENSGKLINPYSGKEDAALYGAVIGIYNLYGINTDDLKSAYAAIDYENAKPSSPYYYKYAIYGALLSNNAELPKTIAQDLIDNYYVSGKGMFLGTKENPFFNCDNTAHFIMTLGYFKVLGITDYDEYINDALDVMQNYIKDDGAFCDLPNEEGIAMSPDVNADSTALAMGAYAFIGDFDNAFKLYKNLVEGFESKTGIFTFGGKDSVYSTKDALIGLSHMANCVVINKKEHPEHVTKTVTTPATTTKEGSVVTTCVIDGTVVSKKVLPKIVPAAPSTPAKTTTKVTKVTVKQATIKKLTKGKKQIKVTWKKLSGVTGYQVQIATNKKFTKNKKSVKVKKAKTVSKTFKKLKAKKTYYVRVRAYKTVKGKTTYGKWSKTKSIKTK